MSQKISIKIAGRVFNLTAATPEQEQLYRQAAESVNNRCTDFTRQYPGQSASDLMSLTALNEAILRLSRQGELEQYKAAEKQLAQDLEAYLQQTGKA